MTNVDTSSWKEFRLEELFEKIKTEKISGKANDFPICKTDEYIIPLLTAGAENHGLARYAKKSQCPTILKNVISISANGTNTGITFYQKDEFAVLQDAYAIKLKDMEIPNEQVGLFLSTCINKILYGNFSWTYKAGWERIKCMSIKLPIKEVEEIDWEYMQERITELEQERITELEQYLVTTGLNDYKLTDEDKEILETKLTDENEILQNLTYENNYLKEARIFQIKNLFEVEGTKSLDAGTLEFKNIGVNFVGRTNENNGIQGKIDRQLFEPNDEKTITATVIGNYKYVKYQEEPYYCSQNVNKLTPIFPINKLSGLYF